MTPEGIIKNAILSWLSSHPDIFAFPIDSTGIYDPVKKIFRKKHSIYHIKGVSDILGIYKGRPLAIEVKSKTGRLSDEQKYFLRRFEAAGGIAIVARSVQDVENILLAQRKAMGSAQ